MIDCQLILKTSKQKIELNSDQDIQTLFKAILVLYKNKHTMIDIDIKYSLNISSTSYCLTNEEIDKLYEVYQTMTKFINTQNGFRPKNPKWNSWRII